MSETEDPVALLIAAARGAMAHAHAPYSRFAVGAAVRLTDGSIVTGCNFENASYGLSLCAETVALATVNAQGRFADVAAIAVVGGAMDAAEEALVTPCGRCRQVMNEAEQMAGRAIAIYCATPSGSRVTEHRIADLLPHAFGPADLGITPIRKS
ncbi:cytidine deaminase [Sphingobium xenophagum]|uniref:Cytidine deaminase n=1 Tax=Sphingobium xenophagum TaxID=121428 RepID=A0ABU1WZQ3_SPHXE|nr:cytidine deaminase [Sphingobium xenophagum]MDR7154432.1 cytidine deaminase [Sphingobium xenophagum]